MAQGQWRPEGTPSRDHHGPPKPEKLIDLAQSFSQMALAASMLLLQHSRPAKGSFAAWRQCAGLYLSVRYCGQMALTPYPTRAHRLLRPLGSEGPRH